MIPASLEIGPVANYTPSSLRRLSRRWSPNTGGVVPREGIPVRGHIAVILRGGAFRRAERLAPGCEKETTRHQLAAVASLMEFIIKPLEDLDNQVDVFVGDSEPDCPMMVDLVHVLKGNLTGGKERAVSRKGAASLSQ